MASDDEDIPPLEDMSELIEKINSIRDMKCDQTSSQAVAPPTDTHRTKAEPTNSGQTSKASTSSSSKLSSSNQPSKPHTFGGFKKGFLSSKPNPKQQKNPTSSTANPKADEMPFVKASPHVASQGRQIPEVQEAMKSGVPLLDSKDWITEDLMTKIQSNPSLARNLMDPRFSQALAHMETNPQEAFTMVQGDPDMQSALQELCSMMGEHFTTLSDQDGTRAKKSQEEAIGLMERSSAVRGIKPVAADLAQRPSPEEEERMKAILSKPEVKLALQDPQIQQIIGLLRTKPDAAQRELQCATPELRSKLKVLIDAGLLAMA